MARHYIKIFTFFNDFKFTTSLPFFIRSITFININGNPLCLGKQAGAAGGAAVPTAGRASRGYTRAERAGRLALSLGCRDVTEQAAAIAGASGGD